MTNKNRLMQLILLAAFFLIISSIFVLAADIPPKYVSWANAAPSSTYVYFYLYSAKEDGYSKYRWEYTLFNNKKETDPLLFKPVSYSDDDTLYFDSQGFLYHKKNDVLVKGIEHICTSCAQLEASYNSQLQQSQDIAIPTQPTSITPEGIPQSFNVKGINTNPSILKLSLSQLQDDQNNYIYSSEKFNGPINDQTGEYNDCTIPNTIPVLTMQVFINKNTNTVSKYEYFNFLSKNPCSKTKKTSLFVVINKNYNEARGPNANPPSGIPNTFQINLDPKLFPRNSGSYSLTYINSDAITNEYVYEMQDIMTKTNNKIWVYINKQSGEVNNYELRDDQDKIIEQYSSPIKFSFEFPNGFIREAFLNANDPPINSPYKNLGLNPILNSPPEGIPSSFQILPRLPKFTYIDHNADDINTYVYIMKDYKKNSNLIIKISSGGALYSRVLVVQNSDDSNEPGSGSREESTAFDFEDNPAIIDAFMAARAKAESPYKEFTIPPPACNPKLVSSLQKTNSNGIVPNDFFVINYLSNNDKQLNFNYLYEDSNYYAYVSPYYTKEVKDAHSCQDLLIYFNKQTRKLAYYQLYGPTESKKPLLPVQDNPAIPREEIDKAFTKTITQKNLLNSLFEQFKKLVITFNNQQLTYPALADTSLATDVSSRALFDYAYGYMKIAELYRPSLKIQKLPQNLEQKLGEDKKAIDARSKMETEWGIKILTFNAVQQQDGSILFNMQFQLTQQDKDFTFNIVVEDQDEDGSKGLYQGKSIPLSKSKDLETDSLRTIPLTSFSLNKLQTLSIDTKNLKSITLSVFQGKEPVDMETPYKQKSIDWTIMFDSSTSQITQAKLGLGTEVVYVFDDEGTKGLTLRANKIDPADSPNFKYVYNIITTNGKSFNYPSGSMTTAQVKKGITIKYNSLGISDSSNIASIELLAYTFEGANSQLYKKLVYDSQSSPIITTKTNNAAQMLTKYQAAKKYDTEINEAVSKVKSDTKPNNIITVPLMYGIMMQESAGDPKAISETGVFGLMQFASRTACGFSKNCYQPNGKTEITYDLEPNPYRNTNITGYPEIFTKIIAPGACNSKNLGACKIMLDNDERSDPSKSILAAAYLTKYNIKAFEGYIAQKELAIAAYNTGAGGVKSHLSETKAADDLKELSWSQLKEIQGFVPFTNTGNHKDNVISYVDNILANEAFVTKVSNEGGIV